VDSDMRTFKVIKGRQGADGDESARNTGSRLASGRGFGESGASIGGLGLLLPRDENLPLLGLDGSTTFRWHSRQQHLIYVQRLRRMAARIETDAVAMAAITTGSIELQILRVYIGLKPNMPLSNGCTDGMYVGRRKLDLALQFIFGDFADGTNVEFRGLKDHWASLPPRRLCRPQFA
jgi:hypothetical protein